MIGIVRLDIVHPYIAGKVNSRYNEIVTEKKSIRAAIKYLFTPSTPVEAAYTPSARAFFLIIVLMLAGLYANALYTMPDLRAPGKLLLLTGLVLIHGVLHWFSALLAYRPKMSPPYLMVQGVLAFAIVSIIRTTTFSAILFSILIGEAVGVIRERRTAAVVVAFQLFLWATNFVWLYGWKELPSWGLSILLIVSMIVFYVLLFVRQAEARARAETLLQELESAHRQLAEYAANVEELTLATERERVARELHDTLAQGLAGLILQLEAADAHLAGERPARAQQIVQQAMAGARATLSDSRRVIDDLRTGEGEPERLAQAVQKEVSRFTDATGIPCALELDLPPSVPAEISEHTQRIVAEGLTNIARHAQANRANLIVTSQNDGLLIKIADDGIGFDPKAANSGHYGLIGMRERARLVGGSLVIESAPKQGTILRLQLPFRPAGESVP